MGNGICREGGIKASCFLEGRQGEGLRSAFQPGLHGLSPVVHPPVPG